MSDEIREWERQPDETGSQWLAFKCYRDLGPARTIPDAWEVYSQEKGLKSQTCTGAFKDWKRENRWDERAAAYDRHQDRQTQAAVLNAHKVVKERLSERADEIVDALIAISLGFDEPHSARVGAIRTALDKLGISDSIDIDVDARVEQTDSLEDVLDDIENLSPAELAAAYRAEIEGEGDA